MNKYIYNIVLWVFLVLVGGCVESAEKAHEHELAADGKTYTCPMHPQIVEDKPGICPVCFMDLVPIEKGSAENKELMLDATQQKLANIKVQKVKKGNLKSETYLLAMVVNNDEAQVSQSSRVSGRIEKLFIKEPGEWITKDLPLYEIYSEQLLTYQQDYLVALEQAKQINNEQMRRIVLAAKQKLILYGVSQKQIMELENTGKPRANVIYYSQQSGYVNEVMLTEGAYVKEGDVMFTFTTSKDLWVEAYAYNNESEMVNLGNQVKVLLGNREYLSEVNFVSPEMDGNQQRVKVRAIVKSVSEKIAPGTQAQVLISHLSSESVLVPVDAVIRDGKGNHVWVQLGNGNFIAKAVLLGKETDNEVEVIQGLTPANRVVVSGAYLLYSEYILKKGGQPIDHQHHN